MARASWRLALPEFAHATEDSYLRDELRDGDRLYLTGHPILDSSHAYVVALDLAAPRVVWSADVPDRQTHWLSPLLLANGTLVLHTQTTGPEPQQAETLGFDAATGERLWSRPPRDILPSYRVVDGALYDEEMRVDERTGRDLPGAPSPPPQTREDAPAPGGSKSRVVAYGDLQGDVVRYDLEEKRELWRFHAGLSRTWTLQSGWTAQPEYVPVSARDREQGVLVNQRNATTRLLERVEYSHLWLLDKDTGEPLWEVERAYGSGIRDTGATLVYEPGALFSDGAPGGHRLLALDMATGKTAWTCRVEEETVVWPQDEALYLLDADEVARLPD